MGEKALLRFLSDRPNIKTVYLCLDNDNAGNDACSRLAELVPEGLTVHRIVPLYKDWNEVLPVSYTHLQYMKAALFNAPSTIGSYYTSLVSHDMYGGRTIQSAKSKGIPDYTCNEGESL